MIPVLVTPPVLRPVSVAEARIHCRLDPNDASEDVLIDGYLLAAIGHLDGWSGLLGRCIMEQTWRVAAPGPGWHVLPMPDVIRAVASYGDGTTEELAVTATAAGPAVSLPAAASVAFTCRMSEAGMDRVRVIVLHMIAAWYRFPEGLGVEAVQEVPLSARELMAALRWRAPL
ncbi:head-tail connector protein [Mangrovicoccus algicola]|uniref:Phage gp6-like head-tail connector protein n=1 Tax=Mangrovicoccus algicola TaxID=2771008 RepID=A0A8J7CUG6_9RHOB|nr:head-tail connector protein [Mangrovicoccus algicola]MBE3637469.1 phage gp6-like head-tail connector protein [Mangrovicoccus algicola]